MEKATKSLIKRKFASTKIFESQQRKRKKNSKLYLQNLVTGKKEKKNWNSII